MKKSSIPVVERPSNPQPVLEKILTAEIDVAERVSDAKDKADKVIAAAQSDLARIKNQILADARTKRDASFNEGVKTARETAEKMVAAARIESEKRVITSRQFMDEAAETVIAFLIGQNQEQQ